MLADGDSVSFREEAGWLVIDQPPPADSFTLEIRNTCAPAKNTELSGLSGALSGRGGKDVMKPAPGIRHLYVMPVGVQPPNPLELLEGPAFGIMLREVTHKFDHVIIDTPAAVFGSDGVVVASRCGSALVVTRKDANKVSKLHELVDSLQAGQVRLAGVVMNEL